MKTLYELFVISHYVAFFLTVLLVATAGRTLGQQATTPQDTDVLRINTDLVQSALTVLDKKGNFVDGLQREQFELVVDGKPRPISFFERIAAGSNREGELAALNNATDVTAKPPSVCCTISSTTR